MSVEEDIEHIHSLYETFCDQVRSQVRMFNEGAFDTFVEDVGQEPWVRKDFVQNNIGKIKQYYAFLMLITRVFHLAFIREIIDKAKHYGFDLRTPIIDVYRNKGLLALDVALHYPLWKRKTYTNPEFHALGFRKEIQKEGYDHFIVVGTVPLLKIKTNEDNSLRLIEPYDWRTMEFGLKTVFREQTD